MDKIKRDQVHNFPYAIYDKIDELVEAVNKLESHKHEGHTLCDGVKSYYCTSEPITQSKELPIIEINNLNFATGAALAEAIRDIKDLKQVIQQVYELAKENNNGFVLRQIEKILKPYIKECL